ncbi:sensor histidine kinase [Spirochaeta dissipatitropha]
MSRQIPVARYIFRLVLLSVLVASAVFSLVMFAAMRRSVADWNTLRDQNLQTSISTSISQQYRIEGQLNPDSLQEILRPNLSPSMYVVVADADRVPLYAFSMGRRLPLEPGVDLDSILTEISGLSGLPNILLEGGEVIGYAAVGTLGFASDPANQQFLRSLLMFLLAGLLLAVVFGLLSALALSRRLSAHAGRIASYLSRISLGERNVDMPVEHISEFQHIAESVAQLQEQLKQEEQLRRQWARDIAHDLRTPVTALKTQFEAIQEQVVSPSSERIGRLSLEVERIEHLVRDLRVLNTMEEPQFSLSPVMLGVKDIIDNSLSAFPDYIDRFVLECEDISISADPHYIQRALVNLLQNAVQYSPDDSEIHIQAQRDESNTVVISIINQGKIASQDMDFIFERLYRGETSRTTSGSGLGLSIARAIIEQHDGWISAESSDNQVVMNLFFPHRSM